MDKSFKKYKTDLLMTKNDVQNEKTHLKVISVKR